MESFSRPLPRVLVRFNPADVVRLEERGKFGRDGFRAEGRPALPHRVNDNQAPRLHVADRRRHAIRRTARRIEPAKVPQRRRMPALMNAEVNARLNDFPAYESL